MNPANIASRFSRNAAVNPDRPALIVAGKGNQARQYTYKQLDEASDAFAAGFSNIGIGKGTRVVLMVLPGPEFFSLAFALFKTGAVLVGVDPGMGLRNLGQCLAEAEPSAFIGNARAHMARRLLGWARQSLRSATSWRGVGRSWLKFPTRQIPIP